MDTFCRTQSNNLQHLLLDGLKLFTWQRSLSALEELGQQVIEPQQMACLSYLPSLNIETFRHRTVQTPNLNWTKIIRQNLRKQLFVKGIPDFYI